MTGLTGERTSYTGIDPETEALTARNLSEAETQAALAERAAKIGLKVGETYFHAGQNRQVENISVKAGSAIVEFIGPNNGRMNVQLRQLEQDS